MQKVGILMPCRGTLEHVQQAVQSILDQTHTSFDFLIINDASDAEVTAYLTGLTDPRVQLIHHSHPAGVSLCLNEGLKVLQTEWIFRMDSDDVALPRRLEKQLAFLEQHPDISLLGTQISSFPSNRPSPVVPEDQSAIGYRLNWSNAFNHPTIAFKRDAILQAGAYDESLPSAQDYDLWTRLYFQVRSANLPGSWLKYRIHENQNSRVKAELSNKARLNIRKKYRLQLTYLNVSEKFDSQDQWTVETLPTTHEWETWESYLIELRNVFKSGKHGVCFDPGRDLARRYLKSVGFYQKHGRRIRNVATVAKSLNRWYALSKGIF